MEEVEEMGDDVEDLLRRGENIVYNL